MEQRISYALGFDLANPVPGRAVVNAGGYFGLESNVPSALRGAASGFLAAVLVRPRESLYNGENPPAPFQFIAGSSDLLANGWAFIASQGGVGVVVGDTPIVIEVVPKPNKDTLYLLDFDGTDAYVYANGILVASAFGITYGIGPDNFGIGGSSDPNINALVGAQAYGALDWNIGGVMVASPNFETQPDSPYSATSPPPLEQFLAVMAACDMVDPGPSPVPGADQAGEFPLASHLWSVRRGLPQLVDGGSETWTDENGGTVLARLGTKAGASVSAAAPQWGHYLYHRPQPT